MSYKIVLSAAAIVVTFIAFVPYLVGILLNKTKPHVFSWVIWSTTTLAVFVAQLTDHGGAGAWPIGVSGVITMLIACLAFIKRADITITRMDCLFFCLAVSAIPMWYLTSDPLWAVVVMTIVDLLGFFPTFNKVYLDPDSEPLSFVILFLIRNILVILALEHYSMTTVLFPAVIGLACLCLSLLIILRRSHTSKL